MADKQRSMRISVAPTKSSSDLTWMVGERLADDQRRGANKGVEKWRNTKWALVGEKSQFC